MPTTRGADWGFIGPAYEAPFSLQDTQKAVNWYVELADSRTQIPGSIQQAKMPAALLGAPGTLDLLTLNASFQARGGWVLPGGQKAIVVVGNTAYSVTYQNGALTSTTLGTLLTAVGPVQIRDNGFLALIVDGTYGYTVVLSTGAFAQVTAPGFAGNSSRLAMIDGWFILAQNGPPGGRNFYLSPLYLGIGGDPTTGQIGPNGTGNWDATQFALADATGDNLVSLIEDQRQLWLIKERATEVWYDAGASQFAFQRLQGVLLQIGIAAAQSISRVDKGLMWLAANERGQNFVIRTQGFNYERVSTHAIDYAISTYATVSDALGWTYQEGGHEFYVLTFPTADVTWVYDLATNLWHERLSFNQKLGIFDRHRGNFCLNFGNQRIIGTWDTGSLALMSRSIYTDGGGSSLAPGTILQLSYSGAAGASTFTDLQGNSYAPYAGTFGSAPAPTLSADLAATYTQFAPYSLKFVNGVTDESVATAALASLNLASLTAWTVDGWWYSTAHGAGGADLLFYFRNAGGFSFWAAIESSGTTVSVYMADAGGSTQINVLGSWALNTPHYFKVTLSAGTVSAYLDGVLIGSVAYGHFPTGNLALELNGFSTAGVSFVGYIGAFRVRNLGDTSTTIVTSFGTSSSVKPLIAWRRTGHIWDQTGRRRLFHTQLQFDINPGVGLQAPAQGSNPYLMLRYSDDGGKTFQYETQLQIGMVGQYKNRAIKYNLGYSRDRVYDVRITDPVPRDIIGATLMLEQEQ
jgi:hypothetical protein